ncbi:protein kinase [bacterium]|nr:protein kinase [bacterium]
MKQNNSYDSQGKILPRSEPVNLPENFPEIFPEILPERYKLGSVLGEGGMGKVYKAYDSFLDQTVSIKFLKNSGDLEKSALRFQKEAKTVSALNHSNIATVLDFGILNNSTLYMVSSYIDAVDLKKRIKEKGPLKILEALNVLEQIADCLDYIHEKGILHRDIKSSNILLKEDSPDSIRAYLLDFGIAKSEFNKELTMPGGVLGSPHYLSPEQAAGLPLDERSDVYSLAVVAYEMISGELPFRGDTVFDIINKHLHEDAPPLQAVSNRADIPAALESLIEGMLVKDPSARVQTMKEVASTCATIREGILDLQRQAQVHYQEPLFAEEFEIHVTPLKEDPDRAKNRKFLYLAAGLILTAGASGLVVLTLQETKEREISISAQRHSSKVDQSKVSDLAVDFNCDLVDKAMIRKENKKKITGSLNLDVYKALPASDGTLPDWKQLQEIENDFYLVLEALDLDIEDLKEIVKAPDLKGIMITNSQNFNDQCLEIIAGKNDIATLRFSYLRKITRNGYAELKRLTALQSLEINHAELSKDDVSVLTNLDTLKSLKLHSNTNLDDEALSLILEKMPNLESLSIEDCNIKGRTLDRAGKARDLISLNLSKNPIDDAGLAKLATSGSNLAYIDLSGTLITGKGLKNLSGLQNLKELTLGNCPNLNSIEIDTLSHGLPFEIKQNQTRERLESLLSF